MTEPLSESLVVKGGIVECTAVVPDRYGLLSATLVQRKSHQTCRLTDIILIPPLEPNRYIMEVENPPLEQRKKLFGLLRVKFVDVLGEWTKCEDALPARHRIGTHDRVDGRKMTANILR